VDRAEISLGNGKTLTVICENQGPDNIYIQSATLNKVILCEPFLTHDLIAPGGTLIFKMGPEPASGGGFLCP